MAYDVTRRGSITAGLLSFLPLDRSTAEAATEHPIAYAATLEAARRQIFGPAIGVVVLGGYSTPGDEGAGRMMIRDDGFNQAGVLDSRSAFVDQAGTSFSHAPDAGLSIGQIESLFERMAARERRLGLDPLIDRKPNDATVASALQAAFVASASADGGGAAITRLPPGHWAVGNTELVLDGRFASFLGQGISASYLHSSVDQGRTAMTLRNYGGTTSDFGLDSGSPGDAPTEARSVQRNGILFDWAGGHGAVRSIEARWFNGFGLRFDTVWDSVIENIITVECGGNGAHAIEFVSTGDTNNHTNINRIQAENSHGRAILFESTCMNMCIDNIHCEGTVGQKGVYSVVLLGTAMSFRNGRFANNRGNVEVLLGGAGSTYDRLSFETGVLVDYASNATGPSERSFISHSTFDRLRILDRNRGKLVVSDCTIDALEVADQLQSIVFVRCIIGSVSLNGNQSDVSFDDCDITGPWTSAGNPTARIRASRLMHGPIAARVRIDHCTVRMSYTSTFNQQIEARNCHFAGDIILANDGARIMLSGRCRVEGRLAYQAGHAFGACSLDVLVEGPVHANWYGTGGKWPAGTLRAKPDAKSGESPYARYDGRTWSLAPVLS